MVLFLYSFLFLIYYDTRKTKTKNKITGQDFRVCVDVEEEFQEDYKITVYEYYNKMKINENENENKNKNKNENENENHREWMNEWHNVDRQGIYISHTYINTQHSTAQHSIHTQHDFDSILCI